MSVWTAIYELAKTKIELLTLRRKLSLINRLGHPVALPGPARNVLVVMAHVADPDAANVGQRLKSFEASLSSIGSVFAACNLTIQLLSCQGMHLLHLLPPYLKKNISLVLCNTEDPMFIGLQAYRQFASHVEDYDYFIFLEDDIILHDSWMLEKISWFDQLMDNDRFLLHPHRFEWAAGFKYYLDQQVVPGAASDRFTIAPGSTVHLQGISFCCFENPHAGIHILSRQKLRYWLRQGNPWGERVSGFGPQESTATYHLLRCFTLLQPHPGNMHFLEVQHYGSKYFQQHLAEGKLKYTHVTENADG